MQNKVIVTLDLDGTLLAHGNQIIGGKKTLDLLNELVNMGVQLVVNTGRLDHDILAIQKEYQLPISARVSQNGCVVVDDKQVRARIMDKKEAKLVWKQLRLNTAVRTEVNSVSNRYWLSPRDPNFPNEYYDSSIIKADFAEIIDYQPCTLFLCVGVNKELEAIRRFVSANCSQLQAVMTSQKSLEIYPVGVSKGQTIATLFKDAYVYGIGDSENDFSVFDVSDQAFSVRAETVYPRTRNEADISCALVKIKEDILNENRLSSLR